ncbi:MAG TPA: DUF4862 family protein [Marinagarivorans sp.]
MKYYVGAYASSPCNNGWDAQLETAFYTALKNDPRIQGLEHPFIGQLHSEDDEWFLANIDPNWTFVFTCVPGIMNALKQNPAFGLASCNEEGRQEAVAFLKQARNAIAKLNAHAGKQVVKAIQIQTAPNQSKAPASTEALKQSLQDIVQWDWQGAQIVIEHCDTLIEGQVPAKGFLSLTQEIEALREINKRYKRSLGITINWGRSVIETRNVQGAIDHIEQAQTAGLLSGLMFSGASGQETEYGAWRDSHMPHAKEDNSVGAEGSLMTQAEIHNCLKTASAHELPIVGIKLGIRPENASLKKRLETIDAALSIIDACK